MRRSVPAWLLGGLALLVSLACGLHRGPSQEAGARDPVPGIQGIITRFRARIREAIDEGPPPALALALVHRDGSLWVEGFGYLDEERSIPVDGETLFSLQSTSKCVTATAVLAAVRDGLVDLDAPITRYLPGYTVHSRFEENPESRMTLRHLLGHRAGFTHEAPVGNNFAPEFPSFEAHVLSIQETWLRYPVGRRHAYSNLGVDLAGYILGRVSGKGFPRYVRESVLEPLGMTSSSFDWETIGRAGNRATGHWSLVESLPLEFALIPSGGLYASANDMAAFLRFQLNDGRVNGRQIIGKELLDQMREPSFAEPGQRLGYGLGLRRYLYRGRPYYNHSGAGFGFKSHMSWYPDLGVGIAVLSNSMDQHLVHAVAGEIIDAIADAEKLERIRPHDFAELEPGEVPGPEAGRLAGSYLGRGSQRIDIIPRDGGLAADFEGEAPELHLVSPTEGFVEWEGGKRELFRFELDGDGAPVKVRRVLYGWSYDFDHGPSGPPPTRKTGSWDGYLGRYEISMAGTALEVDDLREEAGRLYFGDGRLVEEYLPGLFFSVKGEALDLRGPVPTWRNIPLRRLPPQEAGATGD